LLIVTRYLLLIFAKEVI